ncbi:uncharacterized protein LOC118413808 [Branchiostoma floridae]|uniref:Uncharacterized protein LOC118413808 n=1 Tax=Branchiostoma floridae TaxID=7739 RepID=A0A9J7KZ99_BRAFL|nr:uncharacterized protein LOC118413808 [Branchiostoma floridae]
MYRNAEAFQQCVADLTKAFQPDEVDLVAGIDGAGFILGGAIAYHLKKGFLAIRKSGSLCVDVDDVRFMHHSKKEKRVEIRKDAFKPSNLSDFKTQFLEHVNNDTNVDELYNMFTSKLTSCVDKYVLSKTTKGKKHLPYITPDLKRLMRKRDRYYRKTIGQNTPERKDKLKQFKKDIKKRMKECYWSYIESVVLDIDENDSQEGKSSAKLGTKKFWGFLKSMKSERVGVDHIRVAES